MKNKKLSIISEDTAFNISVRGGNMNDKVRPLTIITTYKAMAWEAFLIGNTSDYRVFVSTHKDLCSLIEMNEMSVLVEYE